MVWVLVFAAIALAGLIMLVSYGVWLAHKAADLYSEIEMLGTRAGELAALVDSIELPVESRIGPGE